MNIDELQLEKFAHYKYRLQEEKQYLFCLVYEKNTGKILQSNNRVINPGFDYKTLFDGKDCYRKKVSGLNNIDFLCYFLPISNDKNSLRNFKELKSIWMQIYDEINQSNFSKISTKISHFIKNHYKELIVMIIFMYTAFFYFSLRDLGIPIQAVNINIQELLSILIYEFSGVLFACLFILLLILIIYISFAIVLKIISWIILKLNKRPKIFYTWYANGFIQFIINSYFEIILVLIGILYVFLLFDPLFHIGWDKTKKLGIRADIFQPNIMYQEYLHTTGYPKIAIEKNKIYILAGHDEVYEYVYDLNNSKKYIVKKQKNDNEIKHYEQFCRNIMSHHKSWDVVYEFLRNSPKISPSQVEQIKINDSNFTYHSLDLIFQDNDINATKMLENCNTFLQTKKK